MTTKEFTIYGHKYNTSSHECATILDDTAYMCYKFSTMSI